MNAQKSPKARKFQDGAEISIMLSPAELERRIKEMGRELSEDYREGDLVLVSVLKGSFIFAADLCRSIEVPHSIDFLACSSYHNDVVSSGEVQLTHDLSAPVSGKDVVIVEDIVDTGLTLSYLVELLKSRHPRSVKVAALLDKPSNRRKQVQVDYVGFTIPNRFVIGFGLDYAGKYRNLPYIGVLEKA
ncbi:MAG: hypoxanthine phosphoribosyltransferase [Deltaproteobacteria bacterium]|nr:hypoxanthine phosphoribosyltransferase [Deltaproteobacteria bacterium]